MDDADLEKLIVKPGKLKPKFNRNVAEYELVLNSGITKLNIDPFTRDCNASWTIVGRGTERSLAITEGSIFDLVIEVTAENGSTKNYTISVTSLASNSTYISSLVIKEHSLVPAFKHGVLNYECIVPSDCLSVEFSYVVPDKNTKVEISPLTDDKIVTNYGKTHAQVKITSPDGTVTLCYHVTIQREKLIFPFPVKSKEFKCGVCMQLAHCSVKVSGYWFCQSCLQTITRVNKKHPFTNQAIKMEDDVISSSQDEEMKISSVQMVCGCDVEVTMGDLVDHLKTDCKKMLTVDEKSGVLFIKRDDGTNKFQTEACSSCSCAYFKDEKTFHDSFICSSKVDYKFNHKLDNDRKWEKKLQDEILGQTIEEPMIKALTIETEIEETLSSKSFITSPTVDRIHLACQLFSYETSLNKKNHEAHYKCGVMLEYLYLMEDVFNIKLKTEDAKHPDLDDGEFQTDESMQDDIRALTEMRGYGRNATNTQQLQALDQEYHQLLDQGQSEKADYVQKLYAFKQRQQHAAGKPILQLQNQSNLHKALQKYEDASNLDQKNFLYHLNTGRVLLMIGRLDDAVLRLKCALSFKPTNPQARILLGITMASMEKYKNQEHQIKIFLRENLYHVLYQNITSSTANQILDLRYTFLLDGVAHLLKYSFDEKTGLLEHGFLLRSLVGQSVSNLHKITNRNGSIFKKNQSLLLEGQYKLGLLMQKNGDVGKNVMRTYWRQLSNLTIVFCGNSSPEILEIQRKICEQLVTLLPRSTEALSNYATVLASILEISPNSTTLEEIENFFRASLELEGSNIHDDKAEMSKFLMKTTFWSNTGTPTKDKERKNSTPQKTSTGGNTKTPNTANSKATPQKIPAAKSGAATSRPAASNKTPATKASPSKTPQTKTPAKAVSPIKKTTPVNRSSPMRASGVSKPLPPANRSKTSLNRKSSDKLKTSSSNSKVSESTNSKATDPKLSKAGGESADPLKPEINPKNAQARLGLARLLKQQDSETHFQEIETLYHDVIKMAPSLHDAYIELGELLAPTKPLEAVDVFCRFPFGEIGGDSEGFDDGYLYGEIVRILMREEKFEDERLKEFMTKLGKILGFSTLEKYVTILENKFKYNKMLREIYAGINGKPVDHPDLKQFFKFKCWE